VELGMSREELARRTEWSVYTLASLEAGRIPTPGFFVVADLTRELDLDLQELVQEIEEEVDG
jgi:ribosome-binding protein aMBF1 (putative translation factor)